MFWPVEPSGKNKRNSKNWCFLKIGMSNKSRNRLLRIFNDPKGQFGNLLPKKMDLLHKTIMICFKTDWLGYMLSKRGDVFPEHSRTKMVRMPHRNLVCNAGLMRCDQEEVLWRKFESLTRWEGCKINFEVQELILEGLLAVETIFTIILEVAVPIWAEFP